MGGSHWERTFQLNLQLNLNYYTNYYLNRGFPRNELVPLRIFITTQTTTLSWGFPLSSWSHWERTFRLNLQLNLHYYTNYYLNQGFPLSGWSHWERIFRLNLQLNLHYFIYYYLNPGIPSIELVSLRADFPAQSPVESPLPHLLLYLKAITKYGWFTVFSWFSWDMTNIRYWLDWENVHQCR